MMGLTKIKEATMTYRFIQVKLQEDEFLLVKVTSTLLNESLNSFVKRVIIKECNTAQTTSIQDLVKTRQEGDATNDSK